MHYIALVGIPFDPHRELEPEQIADAIAREIEREHPGAWLEDVLDDPAPSPADNTDSTTTPTRGSR